MSDADIFVLDDYDVWVKFDITSNPPVDAFADPGAAGYVLAGRVSDDGFTYGRDGDVKELRDAAGDLVRSRKSNGVLTLGLTFMETTNITGKLFFGNVPIDANGGFDINADQAAVEASFIIDHFDRADQMKDRFWFGRASFSSTADRQYAAQADFVGFGGTLTAQKRVGETRNARAWIGRDLPAAA